MKSRYNLFLFSILALITSSASLAEVKIDGHFIANNKDCPAYQSIKKKTNPGNIQLTEDMAYEVMSKNKFDATHYRIRVKNAAPRERWVSTSCGTLLTGCNASSSTSDTGSGPSPGTPQIKGNEYLLALSWQPAFCQTHQDKNECQSQTDDRYDATHFTLHGLWPQPKTNIYCGVSKKDKKLDKRKAWNQLPALGLSDDTYSELIEIMPGVASFLQRHEWIKHGTCYSPTPEEYYTESMTLALKINNSVVRDFLAANIGKRVTASEIKAKFDKAFGNGAGSKVNVRCSSGMISELWINLKGNIEANSNISTLLENAAHTGSNCQSGVIDPAGF
ncbi:ribonuclease T [Pseudomonadota bacterium]